MSIELTYLTWVTALTAVMWIPYILNMIMVRGLIDAVGYPSDPAPLSPWAQKMKAAHYNAVENLVVFAALVLTANAVGVSTDNTVMACQVY
ncbi:MAG: MAPEG family protein, partial [Woeseiaceae bacterium]|nr:MAPEG family protein [Woeseiaceae bacterium]